VHQKGHDSGGEHVVAHIGIPRRPQAFKDVEVNIVLGNVLQMCHVRVGGVRQSMIQQGGGIDGVAAGALALFLFRGVKHSQSRISAALLGGK